MTIKTTPAASKTTVKPLVIIGLAILLIGVGWNTGWRLVPGWSADDGVHLRFSSVYGVREYLFNPELLWIASYANLTPLLNLFYSFNLDQFGFDVQAWRTTMAAISVLTVSVFYLALTQYMRPSLALFVASAWALGVPFFYTAATFMTNHYMVGMLCVSLSVLLFSRWVRQGAAVYWIGAFLFYTLAIFSKEVFVPLLALFVFHKPWPRAARGTALIALVLPFYLICRHVVLGSAVGGYRGGHYFDAVEWLPIIGRLLQLPVTLMGGVWQASIFASLLGFFMWRTPPTLRLFAIAAISVVLLPMLPLISVSNITEPDRYFFLASAMVLLLLGLSLESGLKQHTCKPWLVLATTALVLILMLQQQIARVPALVRGLNTQAETYAHALHTKGTLLMLNTELPADSSYWSSVLNAAREAQARTKGLDRFDKVLMVGDPQSPILFGINTQGVPIYKYDATDCHCYSRYTPSGAANLAAISMAPGHAMLMYLTNPHRRPENNSSAVGNSVQTMRHIAPDDPKTLQIAGYIDLDSELDWMYLVLPFPNFPVMDGSQPVPVTVAANKALTRPFSLQLHFPTANLATEALHKLCISVPSILSSSNALLQGQPDYCNVFVSTTPRPPG